jgi:fatty acid desaturase
LDEPAIDHRELIASLSAEQRRNLTETSDRAGLAHLFAHAGLIVLVGGMISMRVPFWPLLLPVQGILIAFLFSLEHESIHRTAFRSPMFNDWVARICGFLILLPAEWFRYFHFAHHRHTQDPECDPELAAPKPETISDYLRHVSGFKYWRAQIGTLLRNAAGRCDDNFVPPAGRAKVHKEARVMLALYALMALGSLAAGSAALLFVWIGPVLLGQPFLRLFLLAEHGHCPFVANMLENSRTTFTNALVRWLAWNMPFHSEHHAFPAVPFHKLPAFHAIAHEHLRVTENGYARFSVRYAAGMRG